MFWKRFANVAIIGFFMLSVFNSPTWVCAEVTQSGPDGFQIQISQTVELEKDAAYQTLVNEFSKWWDASHSYTGKPENLSLDLSKCCMLEQLPKGGFVRHMEIVFHQPGQELRMMGGLGPLQGMGVNGAMVFTFKAVDGKTLIQLNYNVSGAELQELDQLAAPVNQVLEEQLERLAKYCNSKKSDQEDRSIGESDAGESDADKAAGILRHEEGVWDSVWEYLDTEGQATQTISGTETMRLTLDNSVIEIDTALEPNNQTVSRSLRFYNSVSNQLTLLSVGADGNHWEFNQDVDSNVMTSKPHTSKEGGTEVLRFTTLAQTADSMKVEMERSLDGGAWVKVFRQRLPGESEIELGLIAIGRIDSK